MGDNDFNRNKFSEAITITILRARNLVSIPYHHSYFKLSYHNKQINMHVCLYVCMYVWMSECMYIHMYV